MPKTVTQTAEAPPWLLEMRRITGLKETPGAASNPLIMKGPKYIADKYPHQAEYASYYTGDDIAWCGLTVAYCMAVADIEPVFGPTDTDRWMWAQAWGQPKDWKAEEIDEPRLGCVAVMLREGGGHVCLVEAYDDGSFIKGGKFRGRGGNQSDAVTVSEQSVSSVIAWMWPTGFEEGGIIDKPARPEPAEPRYSPVVISSGHGKFVRGASGVLDEVNEARKVVESVASRLKSHGVDVKTYHDDVSKTQSENLDRIVDYHNAQTRALDISVHFNAYQDTTKPMGTECLYVTQEDLSAEISGAIASWGLIDRGAKYRDNLAFLNGTEAPAILIEVCFVDSTADANLYNKNFDNICQAIANVLIGDAVLEEDKPTRPEPPPVVKPPGIKPGTLPPLTKEELNEISAIVQDSKVVDFDWKDRGQAPYGYVEGMAVAFATVVRKHEAGHSTAVEMAKANTKNADKDALAWYSSAFAALRMDNSKAGLDTLRHVWTLLYGLGMRESSGKHCEGRDMSADNVTAETAEAGLFQMSWNARNCCPEEMDKLFDEYSKDGGLESGAVDVFKQEVKCSDDDWEVYGSGDGASYQRMAKMMPVFACETCAIGLRNLRQHWGPINRKEVQIRVEVDEMLHEVQRLFANERPSV